METPDNELSPEEQEIRELADLISKHYESVSSLSESTLSLTTWQLAAKLRDIYPGKFTEEHVYEAMKAAGFEPKLLPGLELSWLLREKV